MVETKCPDFHISFVCFSVHLYSVPVLGLFGSKDTLGKNNIALIQGGMVAVSQLQGPRFNPELRLLSAHDLPVSVWAFFGHSHLPKTCW